MAIFRRHVDAEATAFAWTKTVKTEQENWVEERSDWKPWGEIRNVTSHQESYREPNGVLRTRTWYTYESRQWWECRTLTSSGADRGDVRWPEYTLAPGERVFAKWETYSVTFTTPEKKYEKTLDESQWRALAPGATYRVSFGLLGGVREVTPSPGAAGREGSSLTAGRPAAASSPAPGPGPAHPGIGGPDTGMSPVSAMRWHASSRRPYRSGGDGIT